MPASVNAEQHANVLYMKMWKALALLVFCDHLALLRETQTTQMQHATLTRLTFLQLGRWTGYRMCE